MRTNQAGREAKVRPDRDEEEPDMAVLSWLIIGTSREAVDR
jgi:hypothetical protein